MKLLPSSSLSLLRGRAGGAFAMALVTVAWMLGVGAVAVAPLSREAITTGVAAGVLSAAVGGCLVTCLVRRGFEVSCPSSSIAVIHASLAAALLARGGGELSVAGAWLALSLSVVLMGAMLMLAGSLRMSRILLLMPKPVSAGFASGIALLVIWSQLPVLLGLDARGSVPTSAVLQQVKPAAILVGGCAALASWTCAKKALPAHPILVGLLVGTAVHALLARLLGAHAVGATLGAIDFVATAQASLWAAWGALAPEIIADTLPFVLPYAALLTFQAVMNATVTSASVAALTGSRASIDSTLRAQGVANVLCGCVGGLPLCTNAPLSALAARGRCTPDTVAISCVLVLALLFVAGDLLRHLPLAAFAGVLILSGAGMVDPWACELSRRVLRRGPCTFSACNLFIVGLVATTFCLVSVPGAILLGIVLCTSSVLLRICAATRVTVESVVPLASRSPSASAADPVAVRVVPRGALFFATSERLVRSLARPEVASAAWIILDLSQVVALDTTVAHMVARAAQEGEARGGKLLLAGVDQCSATGQEILEAVRNQDALRWFETADAAAGWVLAQAVQENSAEAPSNVRELTFPGRPTSQPMAA